MNFMDKNEHSIFAYVMDQLDENASIKEVP